jgi:hypothetical protein
MNLPMTQEQIDAAIRVGAALMLRCVNMPLTGQGADMVASIALGAARSLYGDDYTSEQLGVCVMCAKAAYMAGKEGREFVGYG